MRTGESGGLNQTLIAPINADYFLIKSVIIGVIGVKEKKWAQARSVKFVIIDCGCQISIIREIGFAKLKVHSLNRVCVCTRTERTNRIFRIFDCYNNIRIFVVSKLAMTQNPDCPICSVCPLYI